LSKPHSLVNLQSSLFTLPVEKCPIGYIQITADVIYFESRIMLFDGLDNVFFGVTFLHTEISIRVG
jgi:hypothetical protein